MADLDEVGLTAGIVDINFLDRTQLVAVPVVGGCIGEIVNVALNHEKLLFVFVSFTQAMR